MKVVAIGGGTGLSTLLKGLKHFPVFEVTAVVSVTDEGGSSGKLRKELNVPPPGDVRNNIVALAEDENLLAKLMNYRFSEGSLKGHSLGNLIIAALTKIEGSFSEAIKTLEKVLALKGRVLPVSEEHARLVAKFDDGEEVIGEMNIVKKGKKIEEVRLDKPIKALPEVIEAISEAEMIIFGPGSLYTSIITNVLVDGVRESLATSKAKKIYVCNLMTQPGETKGYRVSDHVKELEKYLGKSVDFVIINTRKPSSEVLESYKNEGSDFVEIDVENLQNVVLAEPLLIEIVDPSDGRKKVRHDPLKLASLIERISRW
ncbi:YvcK family protein [Thermotoga sp. KOL6]|uniref:gluconeogenesis factor YvcK family protein n=1 Tax=Thermotoga sp. KOL6 TaxID=126741 RepID=UPI000C769654|nr:YvcK family protein [Thermotoga sp. KOL6]PLV60094.1 hypothetical protein AS005_02045 [Thermotoga sp. KOL6]